MTQTTETQETLVTPARGLRQHDVCLGSGATIIANHGTVRYRGERRMKVELSVRYKNGEERKVAWGADTTIRVLRTIRTSKLQPCVACGELSPNRWCSTSCHVQEDLMGDPSNY